MSTNEIPKCKQRFKGVENFLRRVAFNLGNSPSQTEVKIISCIPIDVTDLQQKIINLEKQLDEARIRGVVSSCDQTAPAVHTALGAQHYTHAEQCEQCCIHGDRSGAATPLPPPTHPHIIRPPSSNHQCACYSTEASNCDSKPTKGLFKKKKKLKKKDKLKTQFVYYAQTTTGPFTDYLDTRTPVKSPMREDEAMSRKYISDVIRKQYAPVPISQELSSSQFSSPVCRDVEQACAPANPYESDICSCCHGTFHNIDHHMATHNYTNVLNTFPAYSYKECMTNASFYDSSLYDMVPVREKPAKSLSPRYESPKRKGPRSTANTMYRPERILPKSKFQPLIINHYARVPPPVSDYTYTKRAPLRSFTKKEKARRISPRRDEYRVDRIKHTETSQSCCIDCGNVYMKRLNANNKVQTTIKPNKPATCKNAECLTTILNDTECQTTTTQSVQIDQDLLEEKKTEETLNQIKSILQSVLTEVKTNATQLKKTPEIKDKSTKDAVVQKGASQGNMPGCSSLLHSFTYSPYNMNPYMASCSRQMTPGPCCFQTLPYPSAKCMQNFPVFIQTPGRHMCAGCYRNSSHMPKPHQPHPKLAATAATNTDSKERSKETEKLIKEIYKSMAVNMEFPTKDTSASEYNGLKSTPRVSVNKSLYRPSVLDEGMRKFIKANGSSNRQKSTTPITTTMNSKLMSNTLSLRSQIVSTTDTERNIRNSRIEHYLENIDAHRKRQSKIEEERDEEPSPEATASDDEASYSDASVIDTYVQKVEEPAKKPDKKGLFSKMLNSVKLFNGKSKNNKKEEPVQVETEVAEESDGNSDDYQTIYSQQVDRRPRYVPHAVRSPYRLKAHSKISYSRHMRDRNQERSKRPPYMEQEYRRHWNERLMFHENQRRYSSDSPYTGETPRYARNPAYWRDYEARSALVNNQREVNPRIPVSEDRPKVTRDDILRAVSNREESAPKVKAASKGLAWLKKHKLGIRCGPQWKKFILEG